MLYMHGYEELGPEAAATAPDFRRYLIGHGYAWGASSFSSTGLIPGRSTDETAALWDYFARKYGRPTWTYVSGLSMGGMSAHIAAERYANRFDAALALCGSAGQTEAVSQGADFFAAAAYVAGLTQAKFDLKPPSSARSPSAGRRAWRTRPTDVHRRFVDLMIALTGGPKRSDREGFPKPRREITNGCRGELTLTIDRTRSINSKYDLGAFEAVTSDEFNTGVLRFPINRSAFRAFVTGNETTGKLAMPLVSLHTTGDGQVPIQQAQLLQRKVDAAGKSDLLVQRVMGDAGHCGFTTPEQAAGLEALVRWVERGEKPKGTNVLVSDLRKLNRTFELAPRSVSGTGAVPGSDDRVVLRGTATLDGASFDARFLGAIVRRPRLGGLVTACQGALPPVERGRFEITVLAAAEASGCGASGAEIVLWTFVDDRQLYSTDTVAWPGNGRTASFDATFSSSAPQGVAPVIAGFQGEVVRRDGRQFPPGTVVEAYVGDTRCGVASTRRSGSFTGYILDVVGPDVIGGCTRGATLTFRIDGLPAVETAVNTPPGQNAALDLTVP